jgi:FAD synthase
VSRLRDEQKFSSVDALRQQIALDVAAARSAR